MSTNHRSRQVAIAVLFACAVLLLGQDRAVGNTLKIYLMAGQSNTVGHARTFYEGTPNPGSSPYRMEYLADNPAFVASLGSNYTFKDHFEANWMQPRDDAWGLHIASSSGSTQVIKPTPRSQADQWIQGIAPLGPGFGNDINTLSKIGPELAFGHFVADQTTDPIFLFKSDTGGTTLAQDWRPPTAAATRPENGNTVGMHYTATMNRFTSFLDELDADLADDGKLNDYMDATGYRVSALVWFQGFNEAVESGGAFKPEYEANLIDFVHDIRAADPRIPNDLGAIIPESSDQNVDLNNARQAAVATLNTEIPGSAVFFRNNDLIGSRPRGYHFHETAESYLEIGWRMGQAAIDNGYAAASTPKPGTSTLATTRAADRANANINVGFEEPDFTVGKWSGQHGGGVVWWEWNADSSGKIVDGGYNSPQAAKLGVDELPNPQSGVMESDGDDMLGFFPQTENFVLSGMSYAHLNPTPANNGQARKAWFSMSGSAIIWGANGTIVARTAGNETDTGVPIVYDQWVPFSMHIDHTTHDVILHYNGQEILNTNFGGDSTFSDNFDVWLDTINLDKTPDPNDYLLLDDITINVVPEPSTLVMLISLCVLVVGRRRLV